jgi:VanZ family protein
MAFYGSLLPIHYQPIDWVDSFRKWNQIPWYQLGIERRADWVANALVMIPSAFFLTGAAYLCYPSWPIRLLLSGVVGAGLMILVPVIEFVQLWFPPRTVSQNDVLAGWIGVVLGIGMWWVFGHRLIRSFERFRSTSDLERQIGWLVGAICLGTIAYSLFPFDLVTNRQEFHEKIRLGRLDWRFFPKSFASFFTKEGPLLSLMKLLPFGVFLGLRSSKALHLVWLLAIPFLIELSQIPIYSKYARLSDAFAGCVGAFLGWWLAKSREKWIPWVDRWWFWRGGWMAATVLFSIAYVWRSRSSAKAGMGLEERLSIFFQYPFTFYYFGSEYESVARILSKGAVFFFIGLLQGLDVRASGLRISFWPLLTAVLWAFGVGVVVETIRLMLGRGIPDSTDLIIYCAAGWLGAYTVRLLPEKLGIQEPTPM